VEDSWSGVEQKRAVLDTSPTASPLSESSEHRPATAAVSSAFIAQYSRTDSARLLTFLTLSLSLSLSLRCNGRFPGEPGLAGFIGVKDDGSDGDSWSYKTWKTPVKSSPPTNQHPSFYRPDALPVAKPTVSKDSKGEALRAFYSTYTN